MPEDDTVTHYRLRVLRRDPAAMIDTFEDGECDQYDAVVFEILDGGTGNMTVFFEPHDPTLDRLEDGAIVAARTAASDLESMSVIFSGALEFEN